MSNLLWQLPLAFVGAVALGFLLSRLARKRWPERDRPWVDPR